MTTMALALGFVPAGASAFCRTTTCAVGRESCPRDDLGCVQDGVPLAWPPGCIEVGVDLSSAHLVGLSATVTIDLVRDALMPWSEGHCADGYPPGMCLTLHPSCGPPRTPILIRFEPDARNASVPGELASTDVQFSDEGVIDRVLIRIQAGDQPLTTDDQEVGYDMQATLTHELGHALGLDHSHLPAAAMHRSPRYGDLSGRRLSADDLAGVCQVYPHEDDGRAIRLTERASSENWQACALPAATCSFGAGPESRNPGWCGWAVAVGAAAWRRNRRWRLLSQPR